MNKEIKEKLLKKYSKDLYGDEFKLGTEEYNLLWELLDEVEKKLRLDE